MNHANCTVGTLPSSWATCFDNSGPIWTQRELLVFPNLLPGQYCLPCFLHNSECENAFFTDKNGNVLRYCEDQIYEGPDHRLVWIDSSQVADWGQDSAGEWTSSKWQVSVFLFTGFQSPNSTLDSNSLL